MCMANMSAIISGFSSYQVTNQSIIPMGSSIFRISVSIKLEYYIQTFKMVIFV